MTSVQYLPDLTKYPKHSDFLEALNTLPGSDIVLPLDEQGYVILSEVEKQYKPVPRGKDRWVKYDMLSGMCRMTKNQIERYRINKDFLNKKDKEMEICLKHLKNMKKELAKHKLVGLGRLYVPNVRLTPDEEDNYEEYEGDMSEADYKSIEEERICNALRIHFYEKEPLHSWTIDEECKR